MQERRYWTALRDGKIQTNLSYPELHASQRDARENLKGMKQAGYPNLEMKHVVVIGAEELAKLKLKLKLAQKRLEEIKDAETTLGQDPDVLRPVKTLAGETLLELFPER